MFKGIKMSHGAIFVTDGMLTLRYTEKSGWEPSKVTYFVLEHELSFEPPSTWDYVFEHELRELPNDGYNAMLAEFERIRKLINL